MTLSFTKSLEFIFSSKRIREKRNAPELEAEDAIVDAPSK
jgi:hypothetical protein